MRRLSLLEAIGGGPANYPNYDSRTGLGYATKSGFHSQRQSQVTYPYKEPISDNELEVDEEERDLEFDSKVSKKLSVYIPTDDLAAKKSDKFYFVGSATPLSAAESVARNPQKTSMVPIPDLYKNRDSGLMGTNDWQVTKQVLNTLSTPHGTSKASILLPPSEEQEEDPELSKLRLLIRTIFNNNLNRE